MPKDLTAEEIAERAGTWDVIISRGTTGEEIVLKRFHDERRSERYAMSFPQGFDGTWDVMIAPVKRG
jgi:hypothetical protein